MYYRLHRLQVSTHRLRLWRTKVKEREARPFRMLVMETRYKKKLQSVFMLLEYQKLLGGEDWSRWLQRHTQDKEDSGKLKNQNVWIMLKLGPECISRRHNCGGANTSSIRVRMRKLEVVKVGLLFADWASLRRPQFGQNPATGFRPTPTIFQVKLWPS